jgi:hypothetical protein
LRRNDRAFGSLPYLIKEHHWRMEGPLALIHLPIAFAVISNLQQPILGIVPLATVGADQIPAPSGALPIVACFNRKSCPATARHQ